MNTALSKKNILITSRLIIPLLLFSFSFGAFAQGLVPCGSPDEDGSVRECTLCDLLVMIKRIIDFLTEVSFVLVTVMLLYGAFLLLTGGGQEQKVRQGKEVITTAIYGLAIVLLSWIIINTVIQLFISVDDLPFPWNEVRCG